MATAIRRIAVNAGGEHVPGLNAVTAGVMMAARGQGWDVVAIRDGYDGLLFPERYPDGGVTKLDIDTVDRLVDTVEISGGRTNPFKVRTVTDGFVDEVDRSDELLSTFRREDIDAVVSVASRRAMSVVWKLERKGLQSICVPVSIENDVAATALSFGYDSTLSFAIELLTRIHRNAVAEGRVAVVEVLGRQSGWLALQAGIAALADAILLPEIPYSLAELAKHLTAHEHRRPALIVVAEGAQSLVDTEPPDESLESTRRALSPGSTAVGTGHGRRVIELSGLAGETVALGLQRLSPFEYLPQSLNQLLRPNTISAVDRQVGIAYGAAAVSGLALGRSGSMVAFAPPHVEFMPVAEAVNAVRTVPSDSHFVATARGLGISLGD